jgi:hypothetical protein
MGNDTLAPNCGEYVLFDYSRIFTHFLRREYKNKPAMRISSPPA